MTAGTDKRITYWDAKTGEVLRRLEATQVRPPGLAAPRSPARFLAACKGIGSSKDPRPWTRAWGCICLVALLCQLVLPGHTHGHTLRVQHHGAFAFVWGP